jgi:F0F1-type ATP synthase assembly protein I
VAGSFGIEIALYVAIGFMGGPWLDHRFHTAPWFTWLGYVVGIGAPINAFVRIVREYNKQLAQDSQEDAQNDHRDPPADRPHG